MSSRYEVIKQFLDVFAVYEKTATSDAELTFDNFLGYALEHSSSQSALAHRKVAGELGGEVLQQKNKKEDSIAILVAYLYRYAKHYVKKALHDSPLQSIDDFSYLIVLLTHESLSKTELINKNVHEKTTGMEIIKRMVKNGLMIQYDDADDRRSQRVAISPQGRAVVFSIIGNMGDVSKIMSANLTDNEKSLLIYLLKKLDHFHFDVFTHERNESLQGIIQSRL